MLYQQRRHRHLSDLHHFCADDLVDAAEAQPADLRTKVVILMGTCDKIPVSTPTRAFCCHDTLQPPFQISYSGPKAALTFNGLQTDPAPPQTFWCEMHQGAQNTLETAGCHCPSPFLLAVSLRGEIAAVPCKRKE